MLTAQVRPSFEVTEAVGISAAHKMIRPVTGRMTAHRLHPTDPPYTACFGVPIDA